MLHNVVEELRVDLGGDVSALKSEDTSLFVAEANVAHILWRFGSKVNAFAGNYVPVETVREELIGSAYVKNRIGVDGNLTQAEKL